MSKKDFTIKLPPKKPTRVPPDLSTKLHRAGGFHKSKAEKGGNTNKQSEYMKEAEEDGCTCDLAVDKGVARGCPMHDPDNRWENC
jgi:hypothetical protein